MEHRDAELSDIEVVLVEELDLTFDQAAEKLKSLGLAVSNLDTENCIIEGTIDTCKLHALNSCEFVKYVRTVFSYIADFPEGDSRNLDKDEDTLPPAPEA